MNDSNIGGTSGRGGDIKVFISYSRGDLKIALRLYRDLKRAGVVPWIDEEDLRPGQNWRLTINKTIKDSHYLIALLSDESVQKRGYVQKELRNALDVLDELPPDDVFVIPVRVDDCEASFEKLADLHWVDLFPSYEDGLNKLLKAFGCEAARPVKDVQGASPSENKTSGSTDKPDITSTAHIIHLSDLHFGTPEKALLWADQLVHDITSELKCPEIDALVISGDIANFSVPEEYDSARLFLEQVFSSLNIDSERLVIVPGNHDLNWEASEDAYTLHKRSKFKGELIEDHFIEEGPKVISVRDEDDYKERFLNFSRFHKAVTGRDYPLEYARQAVLCEIPGKKIVIAGFNSAWELDYHFRDRAAIHAGAVTHAVSSVRDRRFGDYLKIAVWHHPLTSQFEDRIKNHDFLDRMVQAGFCVGLHGHIHESKNDQYRYEMGAEGRKMHIIGAGTFGAPVEEWVSGVPLQYNLLKIEGRTLTVETRQRLKLEGAWKAAAIWDQGPGLDPLPRYFLALPEVVAQSDGESPMTNDEQPHLEIPYLYKTWLADHCSEMDFTRLIGGSRVIRATLPEIYISLTTQPLEKNEPEEVPHELMALVEREKDIEELIAETGELVVEGKAGCGKTTLLKHMAFMTIQEKNKQGLGGWLPLLIFLKDLKRLDPEVVSSNSNGAEEIFVHYFEQNDCGLDAQTVRSFCSAEKVLFLLDGLDEMSPPLRAKVVAAFAALRRHYPDCKYVFSGRPHGVDDEVKRWFAKSVIRVNPLNMEQVEAFIHQWFIHVFERESREIQKTAEDMLGEIRSHQNIADLIDTPLMLTAVCLLYLDDKELPNQRAELYHKFIENLLHRRFPNPEKARNFLMELASRMHGNHAKGIDRIRAVEVLEREVPRQQEESDRQYSARLEKSFDEMEPACALLECDDGQYGFQHLTFQEYLTAVSIAAGVRKDHADAIKGFWGDPWYAEVIELYVGYLSIQNRGIANEIVFEQLEKEDHLPYERWRLALRALLDIHKDRREERVVKKARECIWQIIRDEAEPIVRADAGELLGRIGDDRDLKEFVPVEGGRYELSTGEVDIEPFEIGKYPVTNRWYKEFIEDGGYQRPELWTEQGKLWLEYSKVQNPTYWYIWKWNCLNFPVVGVTWYEADAFIRWLNEVWNNGYQYFLPDENQWEAAATGKEKKKYAWGNDWDASRCNCKESKINRTSAVGIFNCNNKLEKASDLSGNIWEWTKSNFYTLEVFDDFQFQENMSNLLKKLRSMKGEKGEGRLRVKDKFYEKLKEEDRHLPAVRGGSWFFDQNYVCCSTRKMYFPNNMLYDGIGFRCVRAKVV